MDNLSTKRTDTLVTLLDKLEGRFMRKLSVSRRADTFRQIKGNPRIVHL